MRRLIIEEPVSRAAIWSAPHRLVRARRDRGRGRASCASSSSTSLPGFVVARGRRSGSRCSAVLLAFAAFVRIWMEGRRGVGERGEGPRARRSSSSPIRAWYALRALTLPALERRLDRHRGSAGLLALARSRSRRAAAACRRTSPREKRLAQRDAYPQIAPLTLDLAPDEAFELVRKAAANRGWQVIETVRPGGRVGLGRIEAVDRTFLLRLPGRHHGAHPPARRRQPHRRALGLAHRHATTSARTPRRIRAYLDEISNLALALK